MKFNTLFLNLLFNFALAYSESINAESFAVGTPATCNIKKLTQNHKLYYASIPTELIRDNCDNYVVAMNADPDSQGKYRFVKTYIRDGCEDCGPYDLKLSVKAIMDIGNSRKAKVFWAIFSKDGDLFGGPFKPELTESESKKLLSLSGEKNMGGVMKKFTQKAINMVKNKKVHESEFPWTKNGKDEEEVVNVVKTTVIKKTVVKTDIRKLVVVKTKSEGETPSHLFKGKPTHLPEFKLENEKKKVEKPKEEKQKGEEKEEEEATSGSGVFKGTVAVSVAAGAALLLLRRKSPKKTYIFGESLDNLGSGNDSINSTTGTKELYAKTKNGQRLKINIPVNNNFDDVAHIQIFSPKRRESYPNMDVYNVHTQRAYVSDNNSYDSVSLPQPQQEQPQPHAQLPIPTNDFMTAFNPIEQPDLAAMPKENIGSYDCTKVTSRMADDPYYDHYNYLEEEEEEIYNSVPKEMNRVYANNANNSPTDILLDYLDGDDL